MGQPEEKGKWCGRFPQKPGARDELFSQTQRLIRNQGNKRDRDTLPVDGTWWPWQRPKRNSPTVMTCHGARHVKTRCFFFCWKTPRA